LETRERNRAWSRSSKSSVLRSSGLSEPGTHGVFARCSGSIALSLSLAKVSSLSTPATSSYRVTNHATRLSGSVVRHTGASARRRA
jgi:hypothetical protein